MAGILKRAIISIYHHQRSIHHTSALQIWSAKLNLKHKSTACLLVVLVNISNTHILTTFFLTVRTCLYKGKQDRQKKRDQEGESTPCSI